jgi:hypothetical protein
MIVRRQIYRPGYARHESDDTAAHTDVGIRHFEGLHSMPVPLLPRRHIQQLASAARQYALVSVEGLWRRQRPTDQLDSSHHSGNCLGCLIGVAQKRPKDFDRWFQSFGFYRRISGALCGGRLICRVPFVRFF